MKTANSNILALIADYIFVILPFVIILIVRSAQGVSGSFYMLPDWGIAATIVYGQLIVKLATALAKTNKPKKTSAVSFYLTVLIAFGLVVNVVINILMLVIPNEVLGKTQIALFALATICHFIIGSAVNHIELAIEKA
ncbi:hypothetical protein BCV39_14730 [Vibrio sp. 10N.286.55.E10]|uniref:hypothetical protein n=1 Tax=unclassified Vibrio TaxID=2614977 RepID=UPI000C81D449|nr:MULTISPECIES: hypothetical protein [unclassified Vibrio]PME27452.1 hypothetical protein BCV40_16880 [Vibrio sp. 10N.286.55.E12]PME36797.1 hypothetical protein BCV39_14730 [Vibrio sp. 10N.286.55.E10]PME69555.1 hypothetical protein BCV32_01760 [Vibrio sp. 10N.286.55.C11]